MTGLATHNIESLEHTQTPSYTEIIKENRIVVQEFM